MTSSLSGVDFEWPWPPVYEQSLQSLPPVESGRRTTGDGVAFPRPALAAALAAVRQKSLLPAGKPSCTVPRFFCFAERPSGHFFTPEEHPRLAASGRWSLELVR